jgi:flagellar biosynthesis/type III secretory pathway M-ring protein FliF/YscJ
MDRLKQQLQEIQQQLGGLTASQKMLAGSLVAIIAVTLVWWTSYAATGETVKLLEQPLNAEQVGQIRQTLSSRGIETTASGDGILINATRRNEAMSILALERQLPKDLTRHFDKAIGQIGSFDPHKKIDLTILAARQNELASTMKLWPEIRDARVYINDRYKRQVGGDIMPTAGVTLTTTGVGNKSVEDLAAAATAFVSTSVSMLLPENVEVIIDSRLVSIDNDSTVTGTSNKLLELQAAAERRFETKLLKTFSYIPDLRVAVSVDVRDNTTRTVTEEFDPEGKVVVPLETREESDDEENGSGDWGESGLIPNSAMAIGPESGGGESRNRRVVEERNRAEIGRKVEETFSRGGVPVARSCTLSVPLSYIRNEFLGRNPGESEPNAEVLRTFEGELREEIALAARTLLSSVAAEDVMVVTYADTLGGMPGILPDGTQVIEAGAGGGFMPLAMKLLSDYGRTAGVIVLAGVALLFVSSIAKKAPAGVATSQPLGAFDAAEFAAMTRPGGIAPGTPEDEIAEALAADALLVGQEVAEDQLQAGQMVDQVQSLVKENPEAAAGLIKRWINAR